MASAFRRAEAWVLPAIGEGDDAGLELRDVAIPEPGPGEVLVEPLWGSWEANMTHALRRSPLDVCAKRGERFVVLGNCGVVRIVERGRSACAFKEGDVAIVLGYAQIDSGGFTNRVFGYDAPGTVGLLARRTILDQSQLAPVPDRSRHSLQQWAAFGVRHLTAWANWKVARACWAAVAPACRRTAPNVCAWGGGVSLAELQLAQHEHSPVAMIASSDRRLRWLSDAGVVPIDRRELDGLGGARSARHDEAMAGADAVDAERLLGQRVRGAFGGAAADIFIDNVGGPVWRATLRALARPGVVATCGWKCGADLRVSRPMECFQWHVHVHTHFVNRADVQSAIDFAETHGWVPEIDEEPARWSDIPRLAADYESGRCESYFPIFQVNGE